MLENKNLFLKQLEVGEMDNFTYFLGDKNTSEIVLVDPAWDQEKLKKEIKKQGLIVKAVLLTHGHFDHAMGADSLALYFKVPTYVSKNEFSFYKPKGESIVEVDDGYTLNVGAIQIKFISTPGHTPGSMCFLVENSLLLTGDTLFIDGCGRHDLPGGSATDLVHSLHHIIGNLSDDTLIYPGHNYGSKKVDTLKNQKNTNHHLQPR